MTDKPRNNGQLIFVIITGLIFIINGFALFWLSDVKTDVRDLRDNYVDAIKQVSKLQAEVANLRATITELRAEIRILRNELATEKERRGP